MIHAVELSPSMLWADNFCHASDNYNGNRSEKPRYHYQTYVPYTLNVFISIDFLNFFAT